MSNQILLLSNALDLSNSENAALRAQVEVLKDAVSGRTAAICRAEQAEARVKELGELMECWTARYGQDPEVPSAWKVQLNQANKRIRALESSREVLMADLTGMAYANEGMKVSLANMQRHLQAAQDYIKSVESSREAAVEPWREAVERAVSGPLCCHDVKAFKALLAAPPAEPAKEGQTTLCDRPKQLSCQEPGDQEPVQPPCSMCGWPGGTLKEWFNHRCAPQPGQEAKP